MYSRAHDRPSSLLARSHTHSLHTSVVAAPSVIPQTAPSGCPSARGVPARAQRGREEVGLLGDGHVGTSPVDSAQRKAGRQRLHTAWCHGREVRGVVSGQEGTEKRLAIGGVHGTVCLGGCPPNAPSHSGGERGSDEHCKMLRSRTKPWLGFSEELQ